MHWYEFVVHGPEDLFDVEYREECGWKSCASTRTNADGSNLLDELIDEGGPEGLAVIAKNLDTDDCAQARDLLKDVKLSDDLKNRLCI